MSENDDKYRVYLHGGSGQDLGESRPLEELPFCLGILGDFSGRGTRERSQEEDWAARPLVRVTPENVLGFGGLSPRLEIRGLPGMASVLSLGFERMDDFHPDRLFERLDLFAPARDARNRILSGEMDDTGGRAGTGEGGGAGSREGTGAKADGVGLLDAILEETDQEILQSGSDLDGDLDAFIRRVVRPHAIRPEPDRTHALETLDQEIGALMRAVMHSAGFRALESLWRSVVFLLSRVETTSILRVYLVDVSREELASDLLSTDEPVDWRLARTMLGPVSDRGEEIRWAALLGAYDFGRDPDDVPLLQRIALLAELAEVPWISAGDLALAGCRSFLSAPEPKDWTEPIDPLWESFRSSPEAGSVGLATPGFLLRAPYGSEGEKARAFAFEESPAQSRDHLWGNPAFLWGVLCAQAFTRNGWGLDPGGQPLVGGLSMYLTQQGWAHSMESVLSHSAASRLAEGGLMPIVGARDEPEVRFFRMGSVSSQHEGLRAWWEG